VYPLSTSSSFSSVGLFESSLSCSAFSATFTEGAPGLANKAALAATALILLLLLCGVGMNGALLSVPFPGDSSAQPFPSSASPFVLLFLLLALKDMASSLSPCVSVDHDQRPF